MLRLPIRPCGLQELLNMIELARLLHGPWILLLLWNHNTGAQISCGIPARRTVYIALLHCLLECSDRLVPVS